MSESRCLEQDLAFIRELANRLNDADPAVQADVAAILGRQVSNLAKTREIESTYWTVERVNESRQRFVEDVRTCNGYQITDWRLEVVASEESKLQEEQLIHMRALFVQAVNADEPKPIEIRRLVNLLIRGEIALREARLASGECFDREQAGKLIVEWSQEILERPAFKEAMWANRDKAYRMLWEEQATARGEVWNEQTKSFEKPLTPEEQAMVDSWKKPEPPEICNHEKN